jgi:hypothetical protein
MPATKRSQQALSRQRESTQRASQPSASKRDADPARKPEARVEQGRVVHTPKKSERRKRGRYTARTADKYELYQIAVQSPELDVAFHRRVFRAVRGREPLHFREDFCGTGLLSSQWIQLSPEHTAEGFDLDPEPVAWGLAHNFDPLGSAASRYRVHIKDVRSPGHRPPDVRVAQNFSYYCLTERRELLAYFRAARESLAPDGIFVIDLYGGSEAGDVMEEKTRCPGFTYVWDQAQFFPGTGEYLCHIHFRFPDGSRMERAFTYHWRLWYLTELRDALIDAGFERVDNYFEGTAEDGVSGNGVFRKGVRGENCASWVAYLVALK